MISVIEPIFNGNYQNNLSKRLIGMASLNQSDDFLFSQTENIKPKDNHQAN